MESEISSSEVLSVRLLETLTVMTPISTESSASGWQRLAVVDLGSASPAVSRRELQMTISPIPYVGIKSLAQEVVADGFRFDLRYCSALSTDGVFVQLISSTAHSGTSCASQTYMSRRTRLCDTVGTDRTTKCSPRLL